MEIQELLDSIHDKVTQLKGSPMGKTNQFYPGATSVEEPDYNTQTPLSTFNTRPQQIILAKKIKEAEEEFNSEEEFDTGEIGRIYELKKIFSRLISLQSFLSKSNDEVLVKLLSYTTEVISLFRLVIDNVDQFIDDIDNIIIQFYDFLQLSYKLLKKHYNELENNNKGVK